MKFLSDKQNRVTQSISFLLATGLTGFGIPIALLILYQTVGQPSFPVASTTSSQPRASRSHATTGGTAALNTPQSTIHLEVSLSQRQLTVYQQDNKVKTYPIAIGRSGWETPIGSFKVGQMLQKPVWIHPFTDERIPPQDSRNPLGPYWIGFWTDGRNSIGFHGTPDPGSVGSASSHGCIRMYNRDITELFAQVELGTLVRVVR